MTSARPRHAVPVLDAGSERSAAERPKLRRELGMLDAVCLLIAIVVIDTLGSMAKGGTQTLTRLATLTMLFLVPAGLVIADPDAYLPYGLPATALASCSPSSSHWPRWSMPRRRQRTWK